MAQQGAAARKSGSGRRTQHQQAGRRARPRRSASVLYEYVCLRLGRVSAAVQALAHDSHDVMMTRDDSLSSHCRMNRRSFAGAIATRRYPRLGWTSRATPAGTRMTAAREGSGAAKVLR